MELGLILAVVLRW